MARRSKTDAETTRQDIFNAAMTLFATKGYVETTIANICEQAGHTKGALFHHFGSKEGLFDEVWSQMETTMDDAAREVALKVTEDTPDDPYAGFLAGCRVFFEYVSKPAFQQIVNIDGPVVLGTQTWMRRDADWGMRNVGAGLKRLANLGIIDDSKRHANTLLVYGAMQGIGLTLSAGPIKASSEEAIEAFETMVRQLR